ncbi:hypothetical protein [Enterocloster clostridioformis]|uniref:hypothetical protein n=1 Tax=Enterocloster clostridioformis TaxID=1531 RepID=UPI001F48A64C|nr:hypothetical protein [Enterocloster clostridioformis]
MADLGKIAVTDGGDYSATTTYEKLTFVHYQGDTYMTLKTVKGVTPTDDGVNYKLFCKSAELATASKAGIVMPDGTTTTVNSSGKMSAKRATQSTPGIVKGSNSIKVGSDGAIDVNTTFTQAVNLANIITGEAIATILGKVSKAIATTMNLNQNALLKSMLTSIDANDSSKIPTAAYIHTLVERIGMGTQLTAGANLTEAANNLSSNLANKNIIGTYNIPNITGVSTAPENISSGYHNVAKYSNGQCIYSALVYVYTSAIANSVIGTISSQYAPKQDISAYVYDFAGKRFLMILISPDGTIKLLTLEGTSIPESAVKVRGSIVF